MAEALFQQLSLLHPQESPLCSAQAQYGWWVSFNRERTDIYESYIREPPRSRDRKPKRPPASSFGKESSWSFELLKWSLKALSYLFFLCHYSRREGAWRSYFFRFIEFWDRSRKNKPATLTEKRSNGSSWRKTTSTYVMMVRLDSSFLRPISEAVTRLAKQAWEANRAFSAN